MKPGRHLDLIKMARPNLENIPEHEFPPGYAARWFHAGDEAHWLRIQSLADEDHEINLAVFRKYFGSDEKVLGQRQCYLFGPDRTPIGTATAWFDNDFQGQRWGKLHWVAIVPEYQGRGLAKPMMTAVCRRFRELGHERVYLTTATSRISAIRLYQRFGFKPLIRDESDAALWRAFEM